jgi:hypothetical protein
MADGVRHSCEEAPQMDTTNVWNERVQLIYDNEFQIGIEPRHVNPVIDEIRFEGLGGNKQDSTGRFSEALLMRRSHVAVPAMHRNIELFAELFQAAELIIN